VLAGAPPQHTRALLPPAAGKNLQVFRVGLLVCSSRERERQRETERETERDRERETERERQRERDRERQRERDRERQRQSRVGISTLWPDSERA
jgi:hypothetical protein